MKHRTWMFFVIVLFSVSGFSFLRNDTVSDKKGVVTYTDGEVKKRTGEENTWQDAPVNTDVLSGDQVRTYRQSRAELDLAQMDIIRLAPRTIVDIVRLYEETREKAIETQIKVQEGEIWASVHEVEEDTKFDIATPISAAAITGTSLRLRVDSDSTTQLKVYHGEVRITNAPDRKDLKPRSLVPHQIQGPTEIPGPREVSLEEWVYIIKSMQQITIDPRGKVVSSGSFSSDDADEKKEWVGWNKSRDERRMKRLQELLKKQNR